MSGVLSGSCSCHQHRSAPSGSSSASGSSSGSSCAQSLTHDPSQPSQRSSSAHQSSARLPWSSGEGTFEGMR
jgi:hypothetical protein